MLRIFNLYNFYLRKAVMTFGKTENHVRKDVIATRGVQTERFDEKPEKQQNKFKKSTIIVSNSVAIIRRNIKYLNILVDALPCTPYITRR